MDHYAFMIECLADQGIAAEYDPATGGLDLRFEGIEQETVNQILIDCRERDGQPIDVLDAAYLTEYYPFLLELQRCLVDHGLPTPDLVTLDAFIEGGGDWHPYNLMWDEAEAGRVGTTPDLLDAANSCPNDPDHAHWR